QISKKEQILILKGSKFGGNKFPPWSRTPGDTDFDDAPIKSTHHETLDTDVSITPRARELTLSKDHLLHFQSWARADKAIPPPSLAQGRSGSPTMILEKPLDLIQDVGVDCSVVA